MAFTNDPENNQIDRVRLITGDVDENDVGFEDSVYQFVLDKYTEYEESIQESKAALEILPMLLAKYANYVTEKAGGLFVKESDRYEHYKELYDELTKDPRKSLLRAGKGFAGGISLSRWEKHVTDSDTRLNPFRTYKRLERRLFKETL